MNKIKRRDLYEQLHQEKMIHLLLDKWQPGRIHLSCSDWIGHVYLGHGPFGPKLSSRIILPVQDLRWGFGGIFLFVKIQIIEPT